MSAHSRRFGLIGGRVDQSLSPAIYQGFFDCTEIAGSYRLINLSAAELGQVPRLFAEGMDGLNVTAPHKIAVLAFMDVLSPAAAALGAINTIVCESVCSIEGRGSDQNKNQDQDQNQKQEPGQDFEFGSRSGAGASSLASSSSSRSSFKLIGFNTDVAGLRQAIVRNFPTLSHSLNRPALIVGLGGAARASVAALLELGFGKIVMLGRNAASGQEFIESLSAGLGAHSLGKTSLQLDFVALGESYSDLATGLHNLQIDPADAALVVNASSIGHHAHERPTWLDGLLKRTQAGVCDLVYAKDSTPTVFCNAAAQANLQSCDGRYMLVEQARQAFQLWTKIEPPFEAGLEALEAALKARLG